MEGQQKNTMEEENIKQVHKKSHKKTKKQKKVEEEVEEEPNQIEEEQPPKKKKSKKKNKELKKQNRKSKIMEKEIYDQSEEEAKKQAAIQNPKDPSSHQSQQIADQQDKERSEPIQEEHNQKSENNVAQSKQQKQESQKNDEEQATNKESQKQEQQQGEQQQEEQQQEQSEEQQSVQINSKKKNKSEEQQQQESQTPENLQGQKKIDKLFKKMSGKPVAAQQILSAYNQMCDIYQTYDIDEDLKSSLIQKVENRMKSQIVEEQKTTKKRKKDHNKVVSRVSQMDQCTLQILKNGKLFLEDKYHDFITKFGTFYIVEEIQFPRYFLARSADHILNEDLIELIKKDLQTLIKGETNQKDIFYQEIFRHIKHQNQLSLKGGQKRLKTVCRETLTQALTEQDQIRFIDVPCYPPIYGMMQNGTIYVNVNPLSSYHSDQLKVIYCMITILHQLPRYALYHLDIQPQSKPSYPPGINNIESGDIIQQKIFGQRIRYVNEKLYKCLQKYNKGQEINLKKQFVSLCKKKLNGICVDRKKNNIQYQSKTLMRRTRLRL